jgi:hypothetical protein
MVQHLRTSDVWHNAGGSVIRARERLLGTAAPRGVPLWQRAAMACAHIGNDRHDHVVHHAEAADEKQAVEYKALERTDANPFRVCEFTARRSTRGQGGSAWTCGRAGGR